MGNDSNDKLEEFRKEMPANFRDKFDRDSPLVQEYICEWLTETQGRAVFYAQYQFVTKEAKKSIIKRGWGSGTELQELLIPPLEQMLPNYRWSKGTNSERVDNKQLI